MSGPPFDLDLECVTPSRPVTRGSSASSMGPEVFIATSPVTPQPRSPTSTFAPLTGAENERLSCLRRGAARHREGNIVLVDRINYTNPAFLTNRGIIIDWLSDAAFASQLMPQTLHLAVRHMDWYMSKTGVGEFSWQLCAISSLVIAAKFEEVDGSAPAVRDLASMCAGLYDLELLMQMEISMLSVLSWDLVVKTPAHFVTFYMEILQQRVSVSPAQPQSAEMNTTAPSSSMSAVVAESGSGETSGNQVLQQEDGNTDTEANNGDKSDEESQAIPADCLCGPVCYCAEDMFGSNDSRDDAPASAAPEFGREFVSVLYCILDLSLHHITLTRDFPPQVVGAAVISFAWEVYGKSTLRLEDVAVITDLRPKDFELCHKELRRLFRENKS